jgi:hypothetical protein
MFKRIRVLRKRNVISLCKRPKYDVTYAGRSGDQGASYPEFSDYCIFHKSVEITS